MTRESLRRRLEALDLSKPTPRRHRADDDGAERLRATIAAEFGTTARDLFRSDDCPALRWLRNIAAGTATTSDKALFERIAAVRYFAPPVTTAAYLIAIPKVLSDF